MNQIHMRTARESGIASGVKAAALVVILGVFAALADHTLQASRAAAAGPAVAAAGYAQAAQAPALPSGLRTHAGEVPPHVQAF